MLVAFRSSKIVDAKYFVKAIIAKKVTTTMTMVMATTTCRLDGEHRIHVVEKDGEYPPWQTEQSAW